MKKKYPYTFLGAKGLTIDDVGVSRDSVFQDIAYDRELVLKLAMLLEKR